MSCKKYKILLSGYIDQALTPSQMSKLVKHLKKCNICQKEIESLQRVRAICHGVEIPTPHPTVWGDFRKRLFAKLQGQGEKELRSTKQKNFWQRAIGLAASI
jgi:hypothetical protein